MPNPVPAIFRRPFLISSGILWLALMAGCASEPKPEKSAGLAASVPDYPTVMSGTEDFLDGKVAVEVTLGLPTDFRPGKEGTGRHAGGGSHSGRRGGGRRGGGTGAGSYPGLDGSGEGPENNSGDDAPRPMIMGSTLPPAQLKIHLRNTSATDAVTCEIVDFNSALGNFAVYPSRYQIAAGQSTWSEVMTSRMGVEGGDIPVTVAVRTHDQVEKKVITLRLLPDSDHSAVAPTAS